MKLLKILKFLIVGIVWSYFFIICSNFAVYKIWNFNFLSAHSWQIIINFWNAGGIIKTAKDYVFLISLFSLPFIWIYGWRKALKINYLQLLLYPLEAYNRHIINKYGQDSSRVVLRNLKSSQKIMEEIKSQLDSIKPAKNKEVSNIRSQVNKQREEINKTE
ncbi:MAG: hypothetical protein E7018_06500 [Alphaproteobacteria bacterium]|nr:hypothetical protein [Alphaproteobacteria bacterium]